MFARERCAREIERVVRAVAEGDAEAEEAIRFAFSLGEECAREDIMHSACMGYSEARAQRESMMLRGIKSWRPP